jgi:hypothetical protein
VKDVPKYASCVRQYITAPLNQNMFDALVSFTFNLGCGALQGSTLRRKLNAGSYSSVCPELKKWVNAGGRVLTGLVRRRNDECSLFQSCAGLTTAGNFISCPSADACSSCILNSENDAMLALYESNGWDTTCSASNWKKMADDWCNTTNPWECYWKTPGGAINDTAACTACPNMPEPSIPPYDEDDVNITCTTTQADLCPDSECLAIVENSTCNALSGNCLLSPSEDNGITIPTCIQEGDVDSPAARVLVGLISLLLAALLTFKD